MTALMLCVALAAAAFVNVQSAMTESRLRRAQAQLNAVAGMRMALGQLQLLCGDDRRVTATADIFSKAGNASLPRGEAADGKRFWTGVWATGGLDKTKVRDWSVYAPDDKPFLGWLASDYDFTAERPSVLENPVNRTTVATMGNNLLLSAKTGFADSADGRETVTLLGTGALGTKTDASGTLGPERREAKARRVPLERRSAARDEIVPAHVGAYAYWVGDEGVKANVSVPDGTDENFLEDDGAEWLRRFNVASQRADVASLTGLENFDSWWRTDASRAKGAAGTLLAAVESAGTLENYADTFGFHDEKLSENLKRLRHDVTFVSRGVFSDVYSGGLKTDLSLAFEMPWFADGKTWKKGFRDLKQFHGSGEKNDLNLLSFGKFKVPNDEKWWTEQPEDGFGYLYEFATGRKTGTKGFPNMEILRGPTWDLVRNYYRLYKREDEKKGFRGLKPKNADSWIAVGSRPYTYLSGIQNAQQSSEDDPKNALIGGKGNYAQCVVRRTMATTYEIGALLPEFNGRMRNLGGSPTNLKTGASPMIVPQSMRIAPVVRRVVIRCSVVLNRDTAAICFDPIFTIHNPYDVPIEFYGFGAYWTKFFPFKFTLERLDRDEKTGKYKPWPGTNSNKFTRDFSQLMGAGDWTSGSEGGQAAFSSRIFAGTNSAKSPPSGTIRLAPGEVKNVYPSDAFMLNERKYVGGRERPIWRVVDVGDFKYEEKSAVSVPLYDVDLSQCPEDEEITFRVTYGVEVYFEKENDYLTFNLHYPTSSYGDNLASVAGMRRIWRKRANYADMSDENLTQIIAFRRFIKRDPDSWVGETCGRRNTAQKGILGGVEKTFFAYVDIWEQPSGESPLASPLRTNPRPWVVCHSGWDAATRERPTGVGWMKAVKRDNSGLCPVQNIGTWGDSLDLSGQTNIVFFSIPQAPLTSLGQLQHAECSVLDMEPGYVVGNSYAHMGIPDAKEILFWPDIGYMKGDSDGSYANVHLPQPRADTPFAANLNLFDRYFFSGINFGDADEAQCGDADEFVRRAFGGNAKENPFPNGRVTLVRDFGGRAEDAAKADFRDPEKVARDLMLNGAFNVNSTSVEAWCAVLSGLRGKMQRLDGAFGKIGKIPFLRFFSQIGSRAGGFGHAADSDGDAGKGWRWFPELSDAEIRALAEAIVAQVRARGPFMSLGDFVNRRLTSSGTAGQAGAIQAAIDESGINRSRAGKFDDDGKSAYDKTRYPNMFPTGTKLNKAGAPGYVTQGDVLSSVGNVFAARSDTFVIRAYGETSESVSGNVSGRAWCEAVVQRVPEFFEPQADTKDSMIDVSKFMEDYRSRQPAGTPEKFIYEKREPDERLSAVNALFGRRFRIVSFRWLSPDEV